MSIDYLELLQRTRREVQERMDVIGEVMSRALQEREQRLAALEAENAVLKRDVSYRTERMAELADSIISQRGELDTLLATLTQAGEALRQWQQYCEQLPVQKTNIREWRLWQLTNSILVLPHLAKP